jgi:hypothetical protein
VEKHNTEIDKTWFSYILSLMVNYPCSMEEQDKRLCGVVCWND